MKNDDFAHIGTGVLITQGDKIKPLGIGCGAIVSMGDVVLRDVSDGTIVVDDRAKVIWKWDIGD